MRFFETDNGNRVHFFRRIRPEWTFRALHIEIDLLPEQEADFNAWYNQEHLPGLAAVRSTVRAARYVCEEGLPRYHACYDLASLETCGSLTWLAVRATDWSSRVRPSFRNTVRTIFRRN